MSLEPPYALLGGEKKTNLFFSGLKQDSKLFDGAWSQKNDAMPILSF